MQNMKTQNHHLLTTSVSIMTASGARAFGFYHHTSILDVLHLYLFEMHVLFCCQALKILYHTYFLYITRLDEFYFFFFFLTNAYPVVLELCIKSSAFAQLFEISPLLYTKFHICFAPQAFLFVCFNPASLLPYFIYFGEVYLVNSFVVVI